MNKERKLFTAAAALVLICGCGDSTSSYRRTAATVVIEWPDQLGAPERPQAEFDHLKHAQALRAEGCAACHARQEKSNRFDPALKTRIECLKTSSCTEGWHELCAGCHLRRTAEKKLAGPVDCGACHRKLPPGALPRVEMTFDYSLHQRHADALQKELADPQRRACSVCHHAEKPGRETACFDCHRAGEMKKGYSWRQAAHIQCLDCHLKRLEKLEQSGPVDCQGCHDPRRQGEMKKIAAVPRLYRGQADRIWVQTEGTAAPMVPFDHRAHEPAAAFCTTCHHRALKPCGSCHDLEGAGEKSTGVSLVRAHHDPRSRISCIGCHLEQTRRPECAGCHRQMAARVSPGTCSVCHSGPLPQDAPENPYEGLFAVPPFELPPFSDSNFPERLVLDSGGNRFKATRFPHGRVVEKLFRGMEKSPRAILARTFHGLPEVFCSGCHHHQPVGSRPASCRSCHGAAGEVFADRPALREAYHRQCLGCHQAMELEQGCEDCHQREPVKESRP